MQNDLKQKDQELILAQQIADKLLKKERENCDKLKQNLKNAENEIKKLQNSTLKLTEELEVQK